MAEYITKEQIISILYAPRKAILTFEDFVTSIGNLAPADVIERETVKNLIEAAIEDNWELDYALERLEEI